MICCHQAVSVHLGDWEEWGTCLNDFVTGKLEFRDVSCIAGHEVAVQDAQDGFVGNDEEVVVFTLELEDNGFEANGEVVVGLYHTYVSTLMPP